MSEIWKFSISLEPVSPITPPSRNSFPNATFLSNLSKCMKSLGMINNPERGFEARGFLSFSLRTAGWSDATTLKQN